MNQATVQHPGNYFSLEFFNPQIVLITLKKSTAGFTHTYVSHLEKLLREHLAEGSDYCLVFHYTTRHNDSFAPEDIDRIRSRMNELSRHYTCRTMHFVMNEGLPFHINRGIAEPHCTHGVFRAASISDAIGQIERDLDTEITFDSLPLSCC